MSSHRCRRSLSQEGSVIGGGPSQEQRNAATQQAQLNTQLGNQANQQQQFVQQQQQAVNPFYTDLMQNGNPMYADMAKNGLPYYNNMVDAAGGNTARAFAPARAQLERSLGTNANALPNGFATGARTDLSSQQGRAFDDQLQGAQQQNFQAKLQGTQLQDQTRQVGASGLLGQAQLANPLGYYGAAGQGNNSVMNAPLAKPGLAGLLGGAAGGLASAVPF